MASFYLGCFAFGLIFTVASFLLGALGSGHHLHLPGLDVHGEGGHHGAHVSPFNLSTISAFLAWFGGAGYLLSRYSTLTAGAILAGAAGAGIVGGGIIFFTLAKLVLPHLTEMRPEDYEVEGTVGRVTSPIGSGGTGEIVYTLAGIRHAEGARSTTGEPLQRGTEVVILKVERGIAYVERWDQFADRNQLPRGDTDSA